MNRSVGPIRHIGPVLLTCIICGIASAQTSKTVSQLTALTTPHANDLLLIADMTAAQSKKITVANFINNGQAASASAKGFLTAADWILFNAKQAPGNYITGLTGDGTASGPGSAVFTIGAGKVTNAMLAGSIADSKLLTIATAGKVSDSALSSNVPLKNAANIFTALQTINPGASPADALYLPMAAGGSNTRNDSHNIVLRATSDNGGMPHTADWRINIEAMTFDGDSRLRFQSRKDAGVFADRLDILDNGNALFTGDVGVGGTLTVGSFLTLTSLSSAGLTGATGKVLGRRTSTGNVEEITVSGGNLSMVAGALDTGSNVPLLNAANAFSGATNSFVGITATSNIVTSLGDLQAGANDNAIRWGTAGLFSQMKSNVDGVIRLLNSTNDGFTALLFGPSTASMPSLRRSGASLQVRLANNSGDAGLTAANFTASGILTAGSGPTTLTDSTGKILSSALNDVAFANFVPATAASKLVGRGSASGAGDFEEISIGSGLTMTGTTLSASGGGTVTATGGALTLNALMLGAGGTDSKVLASLGTTTTLLHGNAAGAPTFGAVSLTADVSGDLPFANLVQATAASKLIGRGSASGAGDFEEITIGSGLTMTGTTLSAAGGSGANTALSNLASVAINTDLLPASTQGLGNASFPFLASFTGNTTQYEKVSQTAGLVTHAALGSASAIDIGFAPKGTTSNAVFSNLALGGLYIGLALGGSPTVTGYTLLGDPTNSNTMLNTQGSILFTRQNVTQWTIDVSGNFTNPAGGAIASTFYNFSGGSLTLARNGAGVAEIDNGTPGQWGSLLVGVRDAGTTTITNGLTIGHQSTGTPAIGLGSGLLFNIDSSTTADQNAARIASIWTDATHATRTADIVFSTVLNAAALAEKFRIKADSSILLAGRSGDPSSPSNGALWYDSTGNLLRARINGATVSLGAGTVTATGGSLTANSIVLGAGTTDTKVVAGIITDGVSKLTLGVNTTTLGAVKLFGNTSGDATIQPAAIAGTATVITLPNASSTLPIFTQQITFAGPSAARTITLPDAAFTVARTDAAQTFTGTQSFSVVDASTGYRIGGAAAAGKLLVGDGTNFVASTPTYPNAASPTARKNIVSDGTNWVASTETWAVPGTAGNQLVSDGTNWTSVDSGGWIVLKVSGSNATTTGQTFVDITGLVSGTLSSSTLYEIEAVLVVSTTAVTTGTQYAIHCGGSGTAATTWATVIGNFSAANTAQTISYNTIDSANGATFLTYSSGKGAILIKGFVTTPSAGTATISLQHLKVTSGTSTVFIGSVLKYRKA